MFGVWGAEEFRKPCGGDDLVEEVVVKEREGEEEYVGPDVEHFGQMEGGDVVVFVAWTGSATSRIVRAGVYTKHDTAVPDNESSECGEKGQVWDKGSQHSSEVDNGVECNGTRALHIVCH